MKKQLKVPDLTFSAGKLMAESGYKVNIRIKGMGILKFKLVLVKILIYSICKISPIEVTIIKEENKDA